MNRLDGKPEKKPDQASEEKSMESPEYLNFKIMKLESFIFA